MVTRYPYLFYLVLGESIFSELACSLSVVINIRILYVIFFYLRKRKIDLSPILIFHVTAWIFLSIAWLIQNTYVIIFWKSDSKLFFSVGEITVLLEPVLLNLEYSNPNRRVGFEIQKNSKVQQIGAFKVGVS